VSLKIFADRPLDVKLVPPKGLSPSTALPGSPADLGKLIADETEKLAKVVMFSGIKAD
jgi:hypothetical protein